MARQAQQEVDQRCLAEAPVPQRQAAALAQLRNCLRALGIDPDQLSP